MNREKAGRYLPSRGSIQSLQTQTTKSSVDSRIGDLALDFLLVKFRKRAGLALVVGLSAIIGCQMKTPPATGVVNGRLLPCPSSPNCVCSQDPDSEHQIEPIPYKGETSAALARMKAIILIEPRTRIVEERPGYFHAIFTSLVFRFQDDVEVLADESSRVLQIRSASRVGHSDLGINRKRMDRLREQFSASPP